MITASVTGVSGQIGVIVNEPAGSANAIESAPATKFASWIAAQRAFPQYSQTDTVARDIAVVVVRIDGKNGRGGRQNGQRLGHVTTEHDEIAQCISVQSRRNHGARLHR